MLIWKFSTATKYYKVGNLHFLDDKQIAYSDISLYIIDLMSLVLNFV